MLKLAAEQYQKLPILANETTCSGKTYIVTGGNSGLGLETARHLVEFKAAHVVLAVRNLTSGETAKKDIEKTTRRTGVLEVSRTEVKPLECTISHTLNQGMACRHGLLRLSPGVRQEGIHRAGQDRRRCPQCRNHGGRVGSRRRRREQYPGQRREHAVPRSPAAPQAQ